MDVEPIELNRIWSNKKVRYDGVAKIFDQFFVHNDFFQVVHPFRSRDSSERCSYRFHILLELGSVDKKPSASFKFNPPWVTEEELITMVRESWCKYRLGI